MCRVKGKSRVPGDQNHMIFFTSLWKIEEGSLIQKSYSALAYVQI